MSKVIADISMSLDGYVTARGADQEHGLNMTVQKTDSGRTSSWPVDTA